MTDQEMKDLLLTPLKAMIDANDLQKKWQHDRVQNCNRPESSNVLDNPPFEKIRDQNMHAD